MAKKQFLVTLLLLFFEAIAFGQPRSFSKKPEVFINEFTDFIKSDNTIESKEILKQFTTKWDSGKFVLPEQRNIMEVANLMLMNELRIPTFLLFTETMLYAKDSIDEAKYINWSKALIPAIKNGNKTFLTLLNASKNLFKENIIYASESKIWYTSTNNYRFNFDNNRVQIAFKDVDLFCQAASDKLRIYNTSGSYYLDTDEWQGKKGKVTWERAGFGPNNIYAEIISNYVVQFNRAELNVDSVLFINKDFLSTGLYGTFKDRLSSAKNVDDDALQKSKFPQFSSFRKDLELGSYLDKTVVFTGGYSMQGAEIVANGSALSPATVSIKYKNKIRVTAKSEYFSLKEGKITAQESEVVIYSDSGTIFHPKLNFNLNLEKKVLVLTRGKEGLEMAPFFNTDHQVEMYVDQVIWRLDLPKIEFDMTGEEAKAIIESNDFYKEFRYEKIPRGMLKYHPLNKMRDFVIRYRKREFTFTEYAQWMESQPVYLKAQIVDLADNGYIFFNPNTDTIKVRKKLDHAVLSHMKLADYDVIRFASTISARPNAYLDLISNNLVLEGVGAFRFSDSQNVYAFPHEQMVFLKHNRNMTFGGRLTGGKFDFYSSQFSFDYYDFDISSNKIDSMVIFTEDFTGRPGLVAVKSVLRDINGTLEIDRSTNKSGLQNFPEYPRFTSKKGALIAYDKKSIHGGAYDKERFRFEVDPFTIENMDNFTTSELSFPGEFIAGGILPNFRFEAKIMDDYSLGFEKSMTTYPMYGGKGSADIAIKLSEEGFTARGNIEYQGATISSQDIVLAPDYTMANADSYSIDENSHYPNVYAMNVMTKWLPAKDSMFVNTNGHTVKVLRDKQDFQGNLIQTSSQLAGNGVLSWDQAKLTSADMKFKPNEVKAKISQIEIGAISSDKIAFASYNVASDVNFTTRIGDFKANETGKLTDFPFNAYASTMDEYKWDMNKQTIELNKGPKLAKEKSIFISKDPAQQGLRFESTKALFDMKKGIIYAENVPHIDVADSRVFPYNEKIEIRENADMQTLQKAKMLASRDNKNHELFDAKLKIAGRYALSGAASYKYKDKHRTNQVLYFDKIRVVSKTDSSIIATGTVADSSGFKVSPKIGFKGLTELSSINQDIVFNGYVKPLHSLTEWPSAWFRYNQRPDPSNIIIPAREIKNEEQRKMYAAVSLANDSTHIYPTMFNFKRSYADMDITADTGVFYYDETSNCFIVGDSMKLFEGSRRGSFLSFNDATGEVYSEGKLNFGLEVDNNFSGLMAGNLVKKKADSTFTLNSILALNIKLPEECYTRIIEVMKNNGSGNPVADNSDEFIYNAMAEYLDDKKLNKAIENTSSTGEIKPQGDLDRNIFISKMSIAYVPSKRQFIATDPVQIATINGNQVNKTINAKIVITKRRSTARYTLYFEVSKYDWFYIDYYLGSVTVASTDKEFNDIIKEKGPKMTNGKFRIKTASPRSVANFLTKLDLED
jgi:hypothetical protein